MLWITRPGMYTLDSWTVETEVGEVAEDLSPCDPWQTRQRYEQGPPAGDRSYLTVVDTTDP